MLPEKVMYCGSSTVALYIEVFSSQRIRDDRNVTDNLKKVTKEFIVNLWFKLCGFHILNLLRLDGYFHNFMENEISKVNRQCKIDAKMLVVVQEQLQIFSLLNDEDYEIHLVHYKQKNTWDCGISCVMMVLPGKRRHFFNEHLDKICEEEGFGRSTWTIDLCYLLKRFSMNFIFYTIFIGVNPDHNSHYFYEKILHKDTERVKQRFKDAEHNGIKVRKKSVKTSDLISHIKTSGPVILLTNAGYLNCDDCKINNTTSKIIQYLPKAVNYHGHYIVLCGYNLKKRQFYYKNPANLSRTCRMGISAMNKARKCFGTDEDCIFIYKSIEESERK